MVADKTGLTVFLLKESQVAAFETDLLKGTEAVQLQLVSGLDGIFLIFPMPPPGARMGSCGAQHTGLSGGAGRRIAVSSMPLGSPAGRQDVRHYLRACVDEAQGRVA